MLLELKYNVYRPSRLTLKSWLFWNWKHHIHWLKNWCYFDFMTNWLPLPGLTLKWYKLTFVFCSAPLQHGTCCAERSALLSIDKESGWRWDSADVVHTIQNSREQQTVKWPEATKTSAKRPFLSKLNGWVSIHWNLILKVWKGSLWTVYLEILVFLVIQLILVAKFHTNVGAETYR